VVRFCFGTDDLLRTRFAIAPLMDLVGATYVLRWPERYPEHRPWIDWARPRASGLELGLLYVAREAGESGSAPRISPRATRPVSRSMRPTARTAMVHKRAR